MTSTDSRIPTPDTLLEEARTHTLHSPARTALLLEALVMLALPPATREPEIAPTAPTELEPVTLAAPEPPKRVTPSRRKTSTKPTPATTETDAT